MIDEEYDHEKQDERSYYDPSDGTHKTLSDDDSDNRDAHYEQYENGESDDDLKERMNDN